MNKRRSRRICNEIPSYLRVTFSQSLLAWQLVRSNVMQAYGRVCWYAIKPQQQQRCNVCVRRSVSNETWNQRRHAMYAFGQRRYLAGYDQSRRLAQMFLPPGSAALCPAPIRFCWWSRRKIRSSSVIGRISVQSIYYRSTSPVVPWTVDIT